MKKHYLYIDELGSYNPRSVRHKVFVICACSFPDGVRDQAREHADHIKFKYWSKSTYKDISFHSSEIGRKSGAFAIFRSDESKHREFLDDLVAFLRTYPITVFINITDNNEAIRKNWVSETILKRATRHIIESFVYYLVAGKMQGRVIVESATDIQNAYFLKAFSYCLSPHALRGVPVSTIQESLTSMSVVTKRNSDIEEQVADLLAYAARCKYERDELGRSFPVNSYEHKVIKVLESKLYSVPSSASPQKKRLLNKIKSFKVLTK